MLKLSNIKCLSHPVPVTSSAQDGIVVASQLAVHPIILIECFLNLFPQLFTLWLLWCFLWF